MERNLGDVTEQADRVRRMLADHATYQEDTRRLVIQSEKTMKVALQGAAQARADAQRQVAQAHAQLGAARAQVAAVRAQAQAEARALEQGGGAAGRYQVPGRFLGNIATYILRLFRGEAEPPSIV